jgi:hypothetical protein
MRGGPNFKFFLPRVTTHFKYLLLRISCTASQVRGIVLQHIDFFSCAAAYYHLVCYKKTGGRASCCAALCCSIPFFGLLQNWWPRSIQRRMVLEHATARFAAQPKSSARLFSRFTEQLAEKHRNFLAEVH